MSGSFPVSFGEAVAIVKSERDYQDAKGVATYGHPSFHSPEEMILYMEDYLTEARRVASHTWGGDAVPKTMDVIRKVTALGVAMIEMHGAPQREGYEVHTTFAAVSSPHRTVVEQQRPKAEIDAVTSGLRSLATANGGYAEENVGAVEPPPFEHPSPSVSDDDDCPF